MRKTTRTRALSLMLTIFMLISTLSVFPVSVGASAETASPVIVDMSSEASANSKLNPFESGYNSEWVGVYSYDAEEGALSMTYASGANGSTGGRYKYCFKFKGGIYTTATPYMVVTYKTDTAENVSLSIMNPANGGSVATLASDVAVSGNKWVRTAPVLLQDDIVTRLATPNHTLIYAKITAQDASFFIKEVAFFATEEEANEYAYQPVVWDFVGEPTKTTDFGTNARDDFDSGVAIYNQATTYVTSCGYYEHDTENDSAVMVYSDSYSNSHNLVNTHHRFTFRGVTSNDVPTAKRPYMVLKYKTNAKAIGDVTPKLYFHGWDSGTTKNQGFVLLESNAAAYGDSWGYTTPVHVEENLVNKIGDTNTAFQRLNSGSHCQLVMSYNDTSVTVPTDTTVAIQEIIFFYSEKQANAYILENATTDIVLGAEAPETVEGGDTFDVDIVAYTTATDEKEITSANFTLTYDDTLTLNSITPASGIGGEGLDNGDTYGWYFDGEKGVTVSTDAPVVIAKASFTATSDNTEAITARVGFDNLEVLNVSLASDAYQAGFTPTTLKGSVTVDIPAYKLTVPAGITVSVNDGTPVAGDGTSTVDVRIGDKVTLTSNDDDVMIKSLSYKIGDGEASALTAVDGVYTLPTDTLGGAITLEYTTYDYRFIEAEYYMALAADQKILLIPTTAGVNDTTYTLGGEYNEPLYYSSRYDGYVAIVDVNATAGALGAVLTATAAPSTEVNYNGDVNLDGKVTAGDAALISAFLHAYTSDSKASDKPAVTDLMRLSADVCGTYRPYGAYVTVVDSMWALHTSVGLGYTEPEREIEGIIIPTTTFAVADKMLDIYKVDAVPNGINNSYGDNVGDYEFDPLEEALSIKNTPENKNMGYYKFHIILDEKVAPTVTDESWMVITYRTNSTTAAKVQLKSYTTSEAPVLVEDISVSGGEYVFSTPVNIDTPNISANLFHRLKNRTHNALTVSLPNTTSEDVYFQIKEIAFFASEDDALYYIEKTELPEVSTDTYTSFPLYDLDTAKNNLIIYNNDYITNGTAHSYNTNIGAGQVGEYRFHDEQQALEIVEGAKGYKMYIAPKTKNLMAENESWMVLLYRSNTEYAGKVSFENGSNSSDKVTPIPDLSASADKWVYSTPVNVDTNFTVESNPNFSDLFARLRNGGQPGTPMYFGMPSSTSADYDAEQYLFLKEILFFSSKEAALKYIENVPETEATEVVYGTGLSKDQWIDPVAISFDSAEKTALNAVADGDIAYTDDGAKLTGSVSAQFKSEGYLLDNHVLVSLSYRTTEAGTITLGDNVIASDTSVSAGEWVYTEAFELTDEIKAAFSSGEANVITYTGTGDLYIGELVFISNSTQLEAYVSEFDTAATDTYYDGKLGNFTEISVWEGDGLGEWSYAPETAFTLQETEAKYDSSYRMTYRFVNRNEILDKNTKPITDRNLVYFYMRVAYMADNGSGENVSLITVNPTSGVTAVLDENVENTNGEWVLSDAVRIPDDILNALSGIGAYEKNQYEELYQLPAALAFTSTASDAEYAVKNIYFFKTAEDAISFTLPEDEAAPESSYTIGTATFDSVTPVSAVDTSLAADAYKIYVDGTSLKVSAGSDVALEAANKVAEMRVLAGDTYEDVVTVTLASDFVLTGTAPAGEASETVELKYDDRYTFDKAVAYVDSASIASTDAISGEADKALLKRISDETFAASAIGEGTVYFTDGTSVKVTVSAAPLTVIMLAGQSNTEGAEGDWTKSIRTERGQVYSTYASAGFRYISWMMGSDWEKNIGTDALTIYTPKVFVPKSLTTDISYTGNEITYKLDMLNEGANGKGGIDSAIAYEWNRQTGDKVWVINVAHSGSGVTSWVPGSAETDNNFWQAVGVMKNAEKTVAAEIAAGHYTLSHMGYFWIQGCSDAGRSTTSYADNYKAMHNGFVSELAFDHDGDPDTDDMSMEFGGIVLVRRGGDGHNNQPTDYYMNGPRTAQYLMGNSDEGILSDIYLVGNVGDYWRTDDDVTNYFIDKYETEENFKAQNGGITYSMPTTIKEIHPGIHYKQCGYNEIARDAVHNLLRQKGIIEAEAATVTFKLLDQYGVVCDFASEGVTLASGASVKIVPDAAPRYLAGTVSVTTSANITHDGYYTFTSTDGAAGTITFTCSGTSVTVNVN